MKSNIKRFTASCLSGLLLASMTMPVLAQDYSPYYEEQDYSYSPAQQQTYQQPQYQQPVQQNYGQNLNYQQPAYSQAPPAQHYNSVPVQNNYNLPPLQGRVVSVPPGTMIPGAVTTRKLSTQNLRTGDRISVSLNTPFYYGGQIVLPAGTNIMGTVVMAEAAGRAGKNGKLMVVFNQAVTPQGQTMGLSGKLATDDGTGILKGGTNVDRAKTAVKNTAVGAGAGALLGTIFGALSGGKTGKGAAMGTAVGGGTAVAKTLIDKGSDVIIEAGRALDIILDGELRTGSEQQSAPPATQSLPPLAPNYNY